MYKRKKYNIPRNISRNIYKNIRKYDFNSNNGDGGEEGNEGNDDDDSNIGKDNSVKCQNNHIYFYDDVNTTSILALNQHINRLNIFLLNTKMDIKHRFSCDVELCIYLHINSMGGSIFDALGAIDTIRNSKIPVVSIIEGCAASAATFLSIVCKKRQITEHSSMLIHQLSSEGSGTYEHIKDEYSNCKYLHETIIKLYITYSYGKLKKKGLRKFLKHDIWWDAVKCKEYGLIDEII